VILIVIAAGLPVLVATFAVLWRAATQESDRGAWFAVGVALAIEAVAAIWVAMPGGGSHFPAAADAVPPRCCSRAPA
jgi:hypothetical protein